TDGSAAPVKGAAIAGSAGIRVADAIIAECAVTDSHASRITINSSAIIGRGRSYFISAENAVADGQGSASIVISPSVLSGSISDKESPVDNRGTRIYQQCAPAFSRGVIFKCNFPELLSTAVYIHPGTMLASGVIFKRSPA